MLKLIYNGADISSSVSISKAYHDMYADGEDTLHIRFNDPRHLWGKWNPQTGYTIRLSDGSVTTGIMFVRTISPRTDGVCITAASAPGSIEEIRRKAWRQVRLLQVGEEIAQRNGLSFQSVGVKDRLYDYILQDQSDIGFLQARAALESCAVIIFDGRLILYSKPYMEAQKATEVLTVTGDSDWRVYDDRGKQYGACVVEAGSVSGSFRTAPGRIYRPQDAGFVTTEDEAERFAKGLLRSVNEDLQTGYVRTQLLSGYAPGSVIRIRNTASENYGGKVFLTHVRNDYGAKTAKIFYRKPLEGY